MLNGSSATGSVSVNSITYNSPTSVTLNVNATGASGNFNIRIINPDGQQATSSAPILNVNPALPIQLGSFTATVVDGNTVLLRWMTLSELNNYGFEVQKSQAQSSGYTTIPNSFIPGHGTTTEPQYYSYTDVTASPGQWWYRLKQIDLNGSVHYSEGIRVDILTSVAENSQPLRTELFQNYPNPFNPSTNVGFRIADFGFVSLKVYDVLGREVATLVNEEKPPGRYDVSFDASGLSSGVYVYRLSVVPLARRDPVPTSRERFVENRRLVVMK